MSTTANFKPLRFGIKTRHTLQSALVRMLLTVCFQASAVQAMAQEVKGQPEAAQVHAPALAFDLSELAHEHLFPNRPRILDNTLQTTPPRWISLDPLPTYWGRHSKSRRIEYSVTPVGFFLRADY